MRHNIESVLSLIAFVLLFGLLLILAPFMAGLLIIHDL